MVKKCVELTIGKTTIVHKIDTDPDFSFYGEYTDDLKPGVIICHYDEFYERIKTEMERDYDGRFIGKKDPEIPPKGNEYRGFIPFSGGEKVGTKEYYDYGLQDYKRMEEYNKNYWWFIGIYVQTEITLSNGLSDIVRSGGLWGIESDEPEIEIKATEEEEKENLKSQLLKIGFSPVEIEESFKNADLKEA